MQISQIRLGKFISSKSYYSPDQPRDQRGRFGDVGGGSSNKDLDDLILDLESKSLDLDDSIRSLKNKFKLAKSSKNKKRARELKKKIKKKEERLKFTNDRLNSTLTESISKEKSLDNPRVKHILEAADYLVPRTGGFDQIARDAMNDANFKERNVSIFSDLQVFTLATYKDGAYENVNDKLRKSGKVDKRTKEFTRVLNSAIDNGPKFSGTVYRGTTVDDEKTFLKLVRTYKPGRTIKERGFVSTSISKHVGSRFAGMLFIPKKGTSSVLLEIRTKSGLNMKKLGPDSEQEVLLKSNSKFKVRSTKIRNVDGAKQLLVSLDHLR